jgi:hypothetical protein
MISVDHDARESLTRRQTADCGARQCAVTDLRYIEGKLEGYAGARACTRRDKDAFPGSCGTHPVMAGIRDRFELITQLTRESGLASHPASHQKAGYST